eukprot:EG_transcript_8610
MHNLVTTVAITGAVLAVIGAFQVFTSRNAGNAVYLHTAVPTSTSRILANTHALRPAISLRTGPELRAGRGIANSDIPAVAPASNNVHQGTTLAFAGFILTAVSALFLHMPTSTATKKVDWAMATVDIEGEEEGVDFEEASEVVAEGEEEEAGEEGEGFDDDDDDEEDEAGFNAEAYITEDDMGDDDEELEKLLPSELYLAAARNEVLREQGEASDFKLPDGEILRPVNFPGQDGPVDLVELYRQFDAMLGGSLRTPAVGTLITGTVLSADSRGCTVDFGGKTLGYCPCEELVPFKIKHATDVVDVGTKREFEVIAPPTTRRRDDEEHILLSMRTIQERLAWQRVQQYREYEVIIDVIITGRNRGGYMVDVVHENIPAFLPKSQAIGELATAGEDDDISAYMDQELEVMVLDLDPERKRLVVSQRAANPKVEADIYKTGTVHEGIVQNVKPYGVFVDINGMNGLLHISQISHTRIDNVEAIFKVGDKIKCMVLSQDQVQGRLALSTKRLEPTHGDMLTNPQLVYEKAEEMAERFRQDIAAAEKRMQEFEAKLAEQN